MGIGRKKGTKRLTPHQIRSLGSRMPTHQGMDPHEGMDGRLSRAEKAELLRLGYTADEIAENEGAFAANRGDWD